jgi:hypothetical protein
MLRGTNRARPIKIRKRLTKLAAMELWIRTKTNVPNDVSAIPKKVR